MEQFLELIQEKKLGEVLENADLKKYNTYRISTTCDILIFPKNIESLKELMKLINEHNVKWFVMGRGSNVVLPDNHYSGAIIRLDKLNEFSVIGKTVQVDAGCTTMKLARETAKVGLSGFEFLSGVPGTIGGAIYMNAGAYKRETKDILNRVLVLTSNGVLKWYNKDELHFGYRTSMLQQHNDLIVVKAVFNMELKPSEDIETLIEDRMSRRNASQPVDKPSAGSVFRNLENKSVWQLIDEVGLRGKQIGGAKISEKHSNFIINAENATSQNVKDLIDLVEKKVEEEKGIKLILEQEIITWE